MICIGFVTGWVLQHAQIIHGHYIAHLLYEMHCCNKEYFALFRGTGDTITEAVLQLPTQISWSRTLTLLPNCTMSAERFP